MSDFPSDDSNPFTSESLSPPPTLAAIDPAHLPLPESHYPTEEEHAKNVVKGEKLREERARAASIDQERIKDAIQVSDGVARAWQAVAEWMEGGCSTRVAMGGAGRRAGWAGRGGYRQRLDQLVLSLSLGAARSHGRKAGYEHDTLSTATELWRVMPRREPAKWTAIWSSPHWVKGLHEGVRL
jgi:hypothetical protein